MAFDLENKKKVLPFLCNLSVLGDGITVSLTELPHEV